MNRTYEFQQICDSLRNQHESPKSQTKSVNHSLLSITIFASEISNKIKQTLIKVEHLGELSKTTSPFETNALKIDEYIFVVKEAILTLQQNIHQLAEMIKNHNDDIQNKQSNRHISIIVDTLNTKLLQLTSLFKTTLETRTTNLKELEARRERITGHRAYIPSVFDHYNEAQHSNTDVVITIPDMLQMHDSVLVQEVDRANDIEREITGIHHVFVKLAELVNIQGEKTRRIEEAMDETLIHGERATNQLLQVYHQVENNRRLVMKTLGIIMVFIIIWIAFFA